MLDNDAVDAADLSEGLDGDRDGTSDDPVRGCGEDGYAAVDGDRDDSDAASDTGAEEIASDGIAPNCNGVDQAESEPRNEANSGDDRPSETSCGAENESTRSMLSGVCSMGTFCPGLAGILSRRKE